MTGNCLITSGDDSPTPAPGTCIKGGDCPSPNGCCDGVFNNPCADAAGSNCGGSGPVPPAPAPAPAPVTPPAAPPVAPPVAPPTPSGVVDCICFCERSKFPALQQTVSITSCSECTMLIGCGQESPDTERGEGDGYCDGSLHVECPLGTRINQ